MTSKGVVAYFHGSSYFIIMTWVIGVVEHGKPLDLFLSGVKGTDDILALWR